MSDVQRLQTILNNAKVSDDEIRGGIKLADSGYQKVSAQLGTTPEEVKSLLNTLIAQLREDHESEMNESTHSSYTHESDFLGNLTIRNTRTGLEKYFTGSEAAHLIKSLRAVRVDSREEQLILSRACKNRVHESEETSDGFMDEIKNDAGSYNFPWSVDGEHGTATAAYRANNKTFDISIVSIRDMYGEEIDVGTYTEEQIGKQAKSFIGNE